MIRVHQATKVFRGRGGDVRALYDVCFDLAPGSTVCLLGPNGAGKTTLVRLMCGLLLPDAGMVEVDGHDSRSSRLQIARRVGCLLEGTRNVYMHLTVMDNLRYFGMLNGLTGRKLSDRIGDLLELLGLAQKRREYVYTLSRGMQQKLALALALLKDPPYLLLDEPTLGLDVETTFALKRYLRELRAQGKGILLTTHQLSIADELSDEIAIIDCGEMAFRGTRKEISDHLGIATTQYRCIVRSQDLATLTQTMPSITSLCAISGDTATISCSDQSVIASVILQVPILKIEAQEPSLEELFLRLLRNRSSQGESL